MNDLGHWQNEEEILSFLQGKSKHKEDRIRHLTHCEECRETFIHPVKPALMSLCLPCLGDFYLGHHLMGLLELAGYAMVLLVVAAAVTSGESASFIMAAIILGVTHGMDAILTWHVARKGLLATPRAWKG